MWWVFASALFVTPGSPCRGSGFTRGMFHCDVLFRDPGPALAATKYVLQTKFPGCQAFRMLASQSDSPLRLSPPGKYVKAEDYLVLCW